MNDGQFSENQARHLVDFTYRAIDEIAATKTDVDRVEMRLANRIDAVESAITSFEKELTKKTSELSSEISSSSDQVTKEFDLKLENLTADVHAATAQPLNSQLRWFLGFVVGIAGLSIAAAKFLL